MPQPMRLLALLGVCLLAARGTARAEAAALSAHDGPNPISKVLQLISDLQAKIIKEGEEAQKVYTEFSEWCEDRARNVGFEIKTGERQVAELKASIESSTASMGAASAKIDELVASIGTDEADLKAATTIREKESSDFARSEKDLMETVSAIERALGILQREMRKHGSAAMLQLKHSDDVVKALSVMVDAALLGSQDAERLTALIQNNAQQDDDDEPLGAPAASTYKGHSGGIIDTLEDLLDRAKDELDSARKKETASMHNFKMLEQSLKDEIKFANKEFADAKQALAAGGDAKAAAEGELQVTKKGLEEDVETKKNLHQDCMERSQDFEAATKSRGEELKALAEAKKALNEMTAGAETLTYGSSSDSAEDMSFLQLSDLSSGSSSADLANFEAVQLVRNLARREHSSELALLAKRMASAMRAGGSGGDPFGKVKALIKDMIERLLKEGGAEAEHKAYCDKEMAETSEKLADKTAEIDKLTTQIDAMSAKSAQLKADVAALQKALTELAASQAAMDKIRSEDHETFVANKADTEQGLQGVKMALQILREYYNKQDGTDHETAQGAANGIIGMLEVVESDLTKGLAEMQVEEQTAQSEYEQQTQENKISKATKEQSAEYKTKEYKNLDRRLSEATSDRTSEQTELVAVQKYDAKIKEMCITKPETYEERQRRREAEIAGLKEALQILKGESVLLQSAASLRGVHRRVLP